MAINCSGFASRAWPYNFPMPQLIDDSENGDIWTSAEDSEFEREDNAETPDTMLDVEPTNVPLDPRTAPETADSKFKPYYQDCLSDEEITDNIFKLLKEPLKKSKNPTKGYIYALSNKDYPGYIKIGRTGVSIAGRRKSIERCVSDKLRVYNFNDFYRVQDYQRLEKLIHEELRNERRKLACHCGKKDTDSDCLIMHGEWFAISEVEASEVINRWRKWMSSEPYTERALRPTEQLKIDYYNGRAAKVHFQWSDFVEFPMWKLQWIWLYNELHGSRLDRPSRWDSLCKHWKSNLLLYLAGSVYSLALFTISVMLPPALASVLFLAFANSTFVGVSAIWYAA